MASQEECNKLQCKTNVNNDQESNFITVYKKLEQVLNNKNEQFTKKVESLIEVWRQVCLYSLSKKIPYVVQLMDWAKFHTLNIVLNGDWKKFKDIYEQKLLHEVEQTQQALLKFNNVFSLRCKKLAEVIRDPWGNPILYRLLNTADAAIGPEEIEFFCMETGYLVSHRLKKLCESHCEDLALNLVTAFMCCYRMAETQQFNLNATEEQRWFIFDVYIALLFKFKKTSLILTTLKSLTLKEGYELVKRFANKRVKISKIWRHSAKIAQLACQVYVTASVMKPIEEGGEFLNDLLRIWFMQNESDDCLASLVTAIRRIIVTAESASHMYIFCEAVDEKFGAKMKTLSIELYIRALTADMNDMERQKNEKEMDKVTETTKRLAQGFCRLADILEEHVKVSRECVLTSFSLQPTPDRLKRIEDLARRSGYEVLDTGQDWKCKLHPPALPSDELCWICNLCGEYMSQPQIEAAINTNTALCEALTAEHLGLSPQLCDDLAVVLSSPRYQVLSWLLRWEDLHRICVMYLHDPQRTKNLVTELKFVDIDYSVFMSIKREPEDEEVTGIERGYEHFLESEFYSDAETPLSEDSASQDSRPYSLGSDGTGDSPSCFQALLPSKSDPDVLKSLRMFRPNLKRPRAPQTEEKLPEKVFVRSSNTNRTILTPPINHTSENLRDTSYINQNSAYPYQNGLCSSLYSNVYLNSEHQNYDCNKKTSAVKTSATIIDIKQVEEADFPARSLIKCTNTYSKKKPHAESKPKVTNSTPVPHGTIHLKSHELLFGKSCEIFKTEEVHQPKHQIGATLFSKNPKTEEVVHQPKNEVGTMLFPKNPRTEVVRNPKNEVAALLLSRKSKAEEIARQSKNEVAAMLLSKKFKTEEVHQPKAEVVALLSKKSKAEDVHQSKNEVGAMLLSKISKTEQVHRPKNEVAALLARKSKAEEVVHQPKNEVAALSRKSNAEEIVHQSNNDVGAMLLSEKSKTEEVHQPKNEVGATLFSRQSGGQVAKNLKKPSILSTLLTTEEPTIKDGKIVALHDFEQFSHKVNTQKNLMTEKLHNDNSSDESSNKTNSLEHISKTSNKRGSSENLLEKPPSNMGACKSTSLNVPSSEEKQTEKDDLKALCQMREAKVVLNRINLRSYINKKLKRRSREEEKKVEHSENSNVAQQPSILNKGVKKPWPLQDMNPRVVLDRNEIDVPEYNKHKNKVPSSNEERKNGDKTPPKSSPNEERKNGDRTPSKPSPNEERKNGDRTPSKSPLKIPQNRDKSEYPCVLLKRLEVDKRDVKAVLANVPGLNDLELIRPGSTDRIVQVVQIAGGRQTSNVPPQNTQTSTQVSPHIQRVGQPRNDKPEQATETSVAASTSTSTTTTTSKPATSQPSTLINILSQQIIRPGQSNCIRNRTSPLINILSQQIIRPATTVISPAKTTTSTTTTEGTQRILASGEQQVINQLINPAVRNASSAIKTVVGSPTSDQNRIVQFICKSTDGKLIPVTSFTSNRVVKVATTQTVSSTTSPSSPSYEENFTKLVKVTQKPKTETSENSEALPKFQQAFGKTAYQNSMDSNSSSAVSTDSVTPTSSNEADKKVTKTASVNVQSIQGGVIYTRQMPVGQTINLIPPGRGQVFRIATSNSEHTVIHSKMSALLAAALQGKQKSSEPSEADNSSSDDNSVQRVAVSRPTLVQSARIVKPVLHIPSNATAKNAAQPNLSSTTLEQLREFDMVYKQVKERSSTNTATEGVAAQETNENPQRISVTYLNQAQKFTQLSPVVVVSSYCNVQPAASPALSVTSQGSSSPCVTPAPTPTLPKVSSSSTSTKNSKGKSVKNATTHASKASPILKPQQKPQEDEHTTQRIFDILAEYAEQLRNSPDLNNKPAPRRRSNPPTNPNQNSKRKKSTSSKKTGQCSSALSSDADIEDHRTVGSEDSSCGVVQISVQDEEQPQTPMHTSESNDTPVGSCQQLILTDSTHNQTRNLIIADSTVGEALKLPNAAVLVPGNYIMPVSMVKGGQQIAVVSGGSKILATVPARSGPNMLLFQSFLNQTRKTGIPTVKYSTIQPITGGISSQNLTGVTAQPPVVLPPTTHGLSAVTLNQPIALKKLNENEPVNTELLLTISQPQFTTQSTETVQQHQESNVTVESSDVEHSNGQSDTSEKIYTFQKSLIATPIATPVISQTTCPKDDLTDEHHTAAQTIMALSGQECNKGTIEKTERVQSVLVTACTSNGPMLSHTPPNYCKSELTATVTEPPKEDFLRTTEKQNSNEQKHFQANTVYFQKAKKPASGTQRLDRELHQLSLQRKQAALERELRLQKSLSEECEDLGVDEPSTSDLFPEADILFDSNHSPSFDQSSQDIKRPLNLQEAKEETKPTMTLFSDDDNSGSLRTDFLFETVEYQATETELEYDHTRQITNGQSSTSNESGSSCEDNTLLQNCASMSDVTLNSPMTPDPYPDNTPPSLNKYKYKYSNRKKNERHKQAEPWPAEVSSSEDTTGSTELVKSSSRSPEICSNKRAHTLSCEEDLSDSSYKVVRVAISKSDILKEDESCEELHCDEDVDNSLSGRGARRSVKKLCSCCNGSQDAAASRKRPTSRPHTPAPHKKAFLTKKR